LHMHISLLLPERETREGLFSIRARCRCQAVPRLLQPLIANSADWALGTMTECHERGNSMCDVENAAHPSFDCQPIGSFTGGGHGCVVGCRGML
jgi:hypothetical protein